MKYFLDTEFLEDGRTVELISIAIVCEDGRELYLQNGDFDKYTATPWLRENVMPHLEAWPFHSKAEIARLVLEFCDPVCYGKPEFWGYYADYDWVVLCQLFGRMIDLPKGFPRYCRDLKQLLDATGIRVPKQPENAHMALDDARWIKKGYALAIGCSYP